MSNQYSITLTTPLEIVDRVRQIKLLLKRGIGWYPSVNSMAHITAATFTATSWELAAVSQFIRAFCAKRVAPTVLFDHFNTYSNGAFFLAPDERSHGILTPILKDFNQKMPIDAIASLDPHMTIGRQLDTHALIYTRTLLKAVPALTFRIDGLTLRRLNEARGQYDIIAQFPFGEMAGQENSCAWQGLLFR